MSLLSRKSCLRSVLAVLGFVVAGQAGATDSYDTRLVALDGDVAPDAGGETFSAISPYAVRLNASGQVAFGATLTGATPSWGVFVYTDGSGSARALTGDAAPDPLTGTYLAFGFPELDDAGAVSMGVFFKPTPTTSAHAVILAGALGDTVQVADTDPAPGAGGTLDVTTGDVTFHGLGAGSIPIYGSTVTAGANASGVFVGTSTAVALAGAASPVGGTYASFGYPSGNAGGKVVFPAVLTGATAANGLFVDTGSGASALVLEGSLDPEGETFANVLLPSVNAAGEVMFLGEWAPIENEEGAIYIHDQNGLRTVLRPTDPVPGTNGGVVATITGLPRFSDAGRITFSANLNGGTVGAGVFVIEPDGRVRLVARDGDPVPDHPGQTFTSFGYVDGNDAGEVAFAGVTNLGTTGVFHATLIVPVPSMAPVALGLLSASLLALGAALAPRRIGRA